MKKFCGNCFTFRKAHIRAKKGVCTADNKRKRHNDQCHQTRFYTPLEELEVPELR